MNRHDLDRLIETIDAKGFTALSSGLGLGEARPVQGARPEATRRAAPPPSQGQVWQDGYRPGIGPEARPLAAAPAPVAPPKPLKGRKARQALKAAKAAQAKAAKAARAAQASQAARAPKAAKASKASKAAMGSLAPAPRGGFSRRLFAYGLDFFFVAVSLGVALGLATLLTAVRTGETDNLLGAAPVQWVVSAKPYVLLAVVYGAFLAYGLLFKVLAGRTCGETLLRVRPRQAPRKTQETGLGGAP